MKLFIKGIAIIATFITSTSHAIMITGYDINNASVSGTGGWGHTYDGTITTISGSIANYTGGSGTLNDGIISTTTSNNQLFNFPEDTSPVITLYLDDFYSISEILIRGGNNEENSIPGILTGLNVTINSVTDSFTTVATGSITNNNGILVDDLVTLSGSLLDGLVTNTITLSGFVSPFIVGSPPPVNTFSITEIQLTSVNAQVPEPTTLALLSLGLAGLGFSRRRMKA